MTATPQNNIKLDTNHPVRIVTLVTGERILTIFSDARDDDDNLVGYRLLYPFTLSLGEVNEDGTIPIQYSRWCPFSPVEEHRVNGEHIISVVFPDKGILDNYCTKLGEIGIPKEDIYYKEKTDGDNSEPAETAE